MKSHRSLILLFSCLLVFTTVAGAQEKPAQYLEVLTVQVKGAAIEQFEEVVEKFIEAADKVGAAQHWMGATVMFGGTGQTYMFAFPFENWAEVDRWTMGAEWLKEAFGEDEAKKLLRVWLTSIDSSQTIVYNLLEDMITHPDRTWNANANYYSATRTEVKHGMQNTYELSIKKYMAAEEKESGTKMAIRRRSVFGPASIYTTIRAWEKLAEADSMPSGLMVEAYGEEESRRISADIQSCIQSRETMLLRARPDLSRIPSTAPTTN